MSPIGAPRRLLGRLLGLLDQLLHHPGRHLGIGANHDGDVVVGHLPALVEQAFQNEQKTDIPNFMTDVQDLGSLHIVELLRKN